MPWPRAPIRFCSGRGARKKDSLSLAVLCFRNKSKSPWRCIYTSYVFCKKQTTKNETRTLSRVFTSSSPGSYHLFVQLEDVEFKFPNPQLLPPSSLLPYYPLIFSSVSYQLSSKGLLYSDAHFGGCVFFFLFFLWRFPIFQKICGLRVPTTQHVVDIISTPCME